MKPYHTKSTINGKLLCSNAHLRQCGYSTDPSPMAKPQGNMTALNGDKPITTQDNEPIPNAIDKILPQLLECLATHARSPARICELQGCENKVCPNHPSHFGEVSHE